MQIIKRIKSDYRSILKAKIYRLFTRSLWIYLICMFVIASVLPLPGVNNLVSGLIYFISFLILVIIPGYHFSTVRLVKTLQFDADVEFSETGIVVRHRNKDVVETKGWKWISRIIITGGAVVLETRQYPGFMIFLSKERLEGEELGFFRRMSERVRRRSS